MLDQQVIFGNTAAEYRMPHLHFGANVAHRIMFFEKHPVSGSAVPYGSWLSDIWLELTSLKLLRSVCLSLEAKGGGGETNLAWCTYVERPSVTDTHPGCLICWQPGVLTSARFTAVTIWWIRAKWKCAYSLKYSLSIGSSHFLEVVFTYACCFLTSVGTITWYTRQVWDIALQKWQLCFLLVSPIRFRNISPCHDAINIVHVSSTSFPASGKDGVQPYVSKVKGTLASMSRIFSMVAPQLWNALHKYSPPGTSCRLYEGFGGR